MLGDKVEITSIPSWLTVRMDRGYCTLEFGMVGTVIGFTNAGDQVAVQLDKPIWDTNGMELSSKGFYVKKRSSFDTGCHGKGKLGHCAYFYPECLTELKGNKNKTASNDDEELLLLG